MEKIDAAQRHLFDTMSLAASGEALLTSLASDDDPYELRVLIIEAARTADRLDKLDLLVRGDIDTWCVLTHNLQTQDYELKINSALSESRQQGAALLRLLAEIRKQKTPSSSDDVDGLDGL